jgi:hypothetical protein
MSPEKRALKRVAMVVASALGVSVLISVMTMFITPMILVGILLTFGMTYLLIAVYEMFVAQEKIKDNLK